MKSCKLIIRDAVNVRFKGVADDVGKAMHQALKFKDPKARFTPQFKLGRWDGMISFCSPTGSTFLNLLDRIVPLLEDYDIEIEDQRPDNDFTIADVTKNYFCDYVWPDDHRFAGQPIIMQDHQVDVTNRFLTNLQSIQSVATSAGKTLICASLSKQIEPYGRSLVIVPNTSLVVQTEALYKTVGLDVGVWHGEKKQANATHTIATWQSLGVFAKRSPSSNLMSIMQFIEGVTCVIVDEVHAAAANVLKSLLTGPLAQIPIRWGLTGTIPKEEHQAISLLASLGPIVGELRAVELQEKGLLANCAIKIVQTNENHVEFADYASEHKFLMTDPARLQWMADYINTISTTGSTLVLVDLIETGKRLRELIPGSVFVSGIMKQKARKKEYDEVQVMNDKVIIATYGVAAVGLDIPRLFNCVLVSAGKSFVRIIQSIGRILRLASDKDRADVIDLMSNMKFSKRHISKHKEYYREAGYPFTMEQIDYR